MITSGVDGLCGRACDVCVVGAGPVGISVALELARLGRSVVLLESGGCRVTEAAQALALAEIADLQQHVSMDVAVQRRLGGASNLWGGRCVAPEAYDFMKRPAVPESGWPIDLFDLEPYLARACDYLGCGEPVFSSPLSKVTLLNHDFHLHRLERWSSKPRLGRVYLRRLRSEPAIDLRLHTTVVALEHSEDGRIRQLRVRDPARKEAILSASFVVLAAGGLENTRLLLASQRDRPNAFGGEAGPLGRYYMGHLYGSVADMVLQSDTLDRGMDYFVSPDRRWIRRRFTPSPDLQERMALSNAALWPDYPPIRDPQHRNGVLSLAFLALSIPVIGRRIAVESIRRHYVGPDPVRRTPHIANVMREIFSTAGFVPRFFYDHYLRRPHKPGFFQCNAGRRYSIRFHAEHLPNPNSRVRLSRELDALGLPRLAIDLRYSEADTAPLIRTHECFAQWLESTGLGTLTWCAPPEERSAYILSQCYDGHHQIGTTRMADAPRKGIVDRDCRVFGAANLFVAGSSVFPTSGEANPTLTAVTLAVRLAETIAREASGLAYTLASTSRSSSVSTASVAY